MLLSMVRKLFKFDKANAIKTIPYSTDPNLQIDLNTG